MPTGGLAITPGPSSLTCSHIHKTPQGPGLIHQQGDASPRTPTVFTQTPGAQDLYTTGLAVVQGPLGPGPDHHQAIISFKAT